MADQRPITRINELSESTDPSDSSWFVLQNELGTEQKISPPNLAEKLVSAGVKSLNSIADFYQFTGSVDGQQVSLASVNAGQNQGGGIFGWDSTVDKSTADGYLVNDPSVTLANQGTGSGTGVWKRLDLEYVTPEMFGAIGDNSFDNTSAYEALIAAVSDGARVVFATQGAYLGNFNSGSKSFSVDLNGATLTDFDSDSPVLSIGSLSVDEYNVSESTLNHGDTQFTVVGASGLFSVGDIGYLWDQAVRPTGGAVNYEVVKIAAITGDVITVAGFLASYKGASGIRFYHSSSQLKNASVSNGKIRPSDSHTSQGILIANCEGVTTSNVDTENTTGDAVSIRYSYDVNVDDVRPVNPFSTTSGQGYGVALFGVSRFNVKNVKGRGCRHVYDQDSVYFGEISDIEDMDDQSAPFDLAHNGFAGYFTALNLRAKITQRGVLMSSGGYGGTPSADKDKHPFRDVTIKNLTSIVDDSVSVNDSSEPGFYAENSCINLSIQKLNIEFLNPAAVTTATCNAVRIDGIVNGSAEITDVSANRIGRVFFSNGARSGLAYDDSQTIFDGVYAGDINEPFRVQGLYDLRLDNIKLPSPLGGIIASMEATGGDNPVGCYIGDSFYYDFSTEKTLLETTGPAMRGRLPTVTLATGTAIAVSAGSALTLSQIQNRSSWVRLTSPVGAGTTVLDATDALPPPQIDGAEIYLSQPNAGRESVQFPAGNNIWATFTIGVEETVRVVSYSGKWRLMSRYSAV